MTRTSPLIYAELLSNIRQISVFASLDTPCDATTKAELASQGQRVVLTHAGQTISPSLPGRVATNARLQIPSLGSKELSWRLPLAEAPASSTMEQLQDNEAPWSAKQLGSNLEFACRNCNTIVLKEGVINTWKDLPSDNWAEMMEFWHCHKPDVPEHEKTNGASGQSLADSNANRGYGANTKFVARSGTALIDSTTFLVSESDCSGLQTTKPSQTHSAYQFIDCGNCQKYLGRVDDQAEGIRLYKWRLKSKSSTPSPQSSSPSLYYFVAAQLTHLLQSQCTSRVVLYPMGWKPSIISSKAVPSMSESLPPSQSPIPSTEPTAGLAIRPKNITTSSLSPSTSPLFISLWILTPGLRYSASNCLGDEKHSHDISSNPFSPGKLAMKVFWNTVDEEAAAKLQEREDTEELSLPLEAIGEVVDCLMGSARMLPPSARKFQTWNVGLLERYDEG
ncbi:hypothetical protein HYALB_00004178 [Hymenoscyphus albidus]|uniref:Ubiquitin-conjugating enzyme E2-binding protein n=1 Tax=Hymenoscyphus albidus TaxID=595503 RepID=A0A9N9Q8S1_9HELO|nr:hypothetical protein HYALB_00004178 [Hymenoscyphus albidus]